MKSILPRKIFFRCGSIPIDVDIYPSRVGRSQRFGGVYRNEYLIFKVPDNKNPDRTNDKKMFKDELDLLWSFLLENNKISTQDFMRLCPALYGRGSCCLSAFYGIINFLYPNFFVKGHGFIEFKMIKELTASAYMNIDKKSDFELLEMLRNNNVIIIEDSGKPTSRMFWNEINKGVEISSINP